MIAMCDYVLAINDAAMPSSANGVDIKQFAMDIKTL